MISLNLHCGYDIDVPQSALAQWISTCLPFIHILEGVARKLNASGHVMLARLVISKIQMYTPAYSGHRRV